MLWIGLTVATVWLLQHLLPSARANRPLNANSMFLGGLFFMVCVDQAGLAIYYRELKPETVAFACGCIAAFGFGGLLAGSQRAKVNEIGLGDFEQLVLRACLVLTAGYCVMVLPELPRVLQSSLTELRNEHWQDFGEDRGVAGVIKAVFRSGAAILIISLVASWRRPGLKLYFLGGLAGLSMLYIETASQGGRYLFMIFMLAALVNLITYRGKLKFNPLILAVVGVGAYYTLVMFPTIRNPILTFNPAPYFRFVDDVMPAPWILAMDQGWIRDHLIGLSFSSTYITVTPYKLQFYIDALQLQNWYMLGSYNLRYLSFLPQVFGHDAPNFFEAREMIAAISTVANYSGNPWSTGFRDLLIDFGWVGAVFASFVLGWWLTVTSAAIHESNRILDRALGALTSCAGLVMGFLSPFVVTPYLNTVLLLVALKLAESMLRTSRLSTTSADSLASDRGRPDGRTVTQL